MKCEKPEYTPEMRTRLNSMYKLINERFYQKTELMEIFGLGERQIRMMITEISHRFPVISTSGTNSGYKIAKTEEDFEMVKNSWAELSSRREELEKRIKPLMAFYDKFRHKEQKKMKKYVCMDCGNIYCTTERCDNCGSCNVKLSDVCVKCGDYAPIEELEKNDGWCDSCAKKYETVRFSEYTVAHILFYYLNEHKGKVVTADNLDDILSKAVQDFDNGKYKKFMGE